MLALSGNFFDPAVAEEESVLKNATYMPCPSSFTDLGLSGLDCTANNKSYKDMCVAMCSADLFECAKADTCVKDSHPYPQEPGNPNQCGECSSPDI